MLVRTKLLRTNRESFKISTKCLLIGPCIVGKLCKARTSSLEVTIKNNDFILKTKFTHLR